MSSWTTERITRVHHWNSTLFSIQTTRDLRLRFQSGQFLMIGLQIAGKPLMRAYSIASAPYEEHLEFLSIKVENGPLTQHLQHVQVRDPIWVSQKPTGTLLLDDLLPGKHLYLLATGTGLAPFMSVIKDPELYARFEKVVLVHGVRTCDALAYMDYIQYELPQHPLCGAAAQAQLIYYPTVTRESFRTQGRITDLIQTGRLFADIGLPSLDPSIDRVMICGGPEVLTDLTAILEAGAFQVSPRIGEPGHYVIERAFVEK